MGKRREDLASVEVIGDPACPHCMVIQALADFAERERGGSMKARESIQALVACLVEICDSGPDAEARGRGQSAMLDCFQKRGISLMCVAGTA